MGAYLKRLIATLTDGVLGSGHPELTLVDLARDGDAMLALIAAEEWPFVATDVAVSHAQGSPSFVARKDGRMAGFFTTHAFGDIGYLDMMIIAPHARGAAIARPLYFTTLKAMRRAGSRGFVVHTTNDSARLIRLLGFRPGADYTLLVRDGAATDALSLLNDDGWDLDRQVAFDARCFGRERRGWVAALHQVGGGVFRGISDDGRLVASLCLRPRRDGAVCIDQVEVEERTTLRELVEPALAELDGRTLQCFARTGSELHTLLLEHGFAVPDFFAPIGPLVEWRRGRTTDVGRSTALQSLVWL